jgi:hypothetical protein
MSIDMDWSYEIVSEADCHNPPGQRHALTVPYMPDNALVCVLTKPVIS